MRLLFFSNVHPNPLAPGKGTFNGALVRALGQHHAVHVICPVSWIDRFRSQRASFSNSPILLQPTVTASYPTFWYPPKLFRSRYHQWLEWSVRARVDRDLKSFQPDAVISYWAHPDGSVALQIARQLGVPAISMVGGSDVLLIGRQGPRRQAILQTLRDSDAVIAVSEDIAQQLTDDGVPASKMHVVRRGVDEEIFRSGDQIAARRKLGLPIEARILVGVGRLVPVKDWPTLVTACAEINQTQAVQCHILGDGPGRGALERQIASLGLADRVKLQGGQPQSQLGDWYRAADLVVLPSLSEGVPNVLLEAISCGTPFVASQVGGIPEIADPNRDRLVPPRQSRALAAAILERLSTTIATVPRRITPLTWQASAQQVIDIVQACQERRQQRVPTASAMRDSTFDASPMCLSETLSNSALQVQGVQP